MVNCYEALRGLCNSLRVRNGSESESSDQSMGSDLNLSQYKVGMLTASLEELHGLLSLSGRLSGLDADLEIELHRCKESLDRLEKDHVEKNEELKSRAELIQNLSGKVNTKPRASNFELIVFIPVGDQRNRTTRGSGSGVDSES